MSGKFLGVMTGVAMLALVGAANAGGPVSLTDTQLDTVVAGYDYIGFADVVAGVSNATSVGNGTFALSNNADGTSSASISGTFATSGTGTPSMVLLAVRVGPNG
jgi:hypothetical protein